MFYVYINVRIKFCLEIVNLLNIISNHQFTHIHLSNYLGKFIKQNVYKKFQFLTGKYKI